MTVEDLLAEFDAARVEAHVRHITETIPTRLAGSENGARMADYSARELEAAGIEASVVPLPGLVSFPGDADLQLLAPVEEAMPASTLGHSAETPAAEVEGDVVYVASGSFADYEGKDVRGKIALGELSYSPARQEKQRIAALKGATALVLVNWGHDSSDALPFGSVKPAWGNPTPEIYEAELPKIPCIGVSRRDGIKLIEQSSGAGLRLRLKATVDNRWCDIHNTIGRLRTGDDRDIVIAGGHQDSWFGPQATDNAAGSGVLLELARVLARHRDSLQRDIVFGFWAGHETGTMVGSSWYADQHWDELRRRGCAYLEVDQPGIVGTSRWVTYSNVELRRFHRAVEARVLGRESEWGLLTKMGDASFFGLGIPEIAVTNEFTAEELARSSNAGMGWWHHSVHNTVDKLDWDLVGDYVRLYGAYLWDLCTQPILPFEFGGVAGQIADRLDEIDGLPGAGTLSRRAEELALAARDLDAAATAWRRRYDSGTENDDEPARLIDDCHKRLSRTLVPVASTVAGAYGHDPYGFTPQETMLPGLYDAAELAKLDPESERARLLSTKLVRQRNRLADALDDACETIRTTLRLLPSA